MAQENSLRLTFGYEDSEQKRNYTFSGVKSSVMPDIKDKVEAINASLAAGTDTSLAAFFTDNDGNNFKKIEQAVLTVTTETPLDLGGN